MWLKHCKVNTCIKGLLISGHRLTNAIPAYRQVEVSHCESIGLVGRVEVD